MGLQVTRLKNVYFENTHTQHDTVSVSIKILYLVLQIFPLHVMPLHRVTIKIFYLVLQLLFGTGNAIETSLCYVLQFFFLLHVMPLRQVKIKII